jgi:GGDEF domain-containing protein
LRNQIFNVKNESVKVASSKEQQAEGAFYCGYREFYAIYILEKRRGERSGEPICPVSIKLDNGKNVFESEKQVALAVKNFKRILSSSLRRGDTFTLINKSEFLVMLPNMEFRQVCFVIDRIINKFKSEEAYKNIYLNAQVYLPTE